ncbi:MAG: long-chain fatty acid--CoA ligase [Alphaproteobacteria bacterium]|nr:long-chain fatty acid--CoA ligase [Alphaproteobacteria bacterium]
MSLLEELAGRQGDPRRPFLLGREMELSLADVLAAAVPGLGEVRAGDVVALVGDFDAPSILALLRLIEAGAVIMPLTRATQADHDYFLASGLADLAIEDGAVRRLRQERAAHPLLDELRRHGHPGLILFSSGTTGRPKAILHDFSRFLARYRTPRPTLRTLSFLLFDHIGGINTLLHTLFNGGQVVVPSGRMPEAVLADIRDFAVELLPTTPTFLRMLLIGGLLEEGLPASLRAITYGTERMDEGTLRRLCALLPRVDFRQTYGMSELGILRVRTRARDQLWMQVGGEGVETRIEAGRLFLRAAGRMLGYLNAPSPFDAEGWYDTRDLVEQDGGWLRIVGRVSETISVGGLKFLPGEVERVALAHPDMRQARAVGVANPITGQHVELTCELRPGAQADRAALREWFRARLPEHMRPHRIRFGEVAVGHRFKRL